MSDSGKYTERSEDNTITLHPKPGSHSATVVIMHGLGDSADGFADVAEALHSAYPHIKFILPTAHTMPVTLVRRTPSKIIESLFT